MSALTEGTCVHVAPETVTISRTVKKEHAEPGRASSRVIYTSVPDHDLTADIELWIDYASILRQLSEKAIRSKGQKAQAMAGAVVVRARNPRKVKEYAS